VFFEKLFAVLPDKPEVLPDKPLPLPENCSVVIIRSAASGIGEDMENMLELLAEVC
jgi:hypothetical protein